MQSILEISYTPGDNATFIFDTFALTIKGKVSDDLSSRIRESVVDSTATLLNFLGSADTSTMHDFALVFFSNGSYRCLLRGGFCIDITTADGKVQSKHGNGYYTWSEFSVESAKELVVYEKENRNQTLLPITKGIVVSDGFKLIFAESNEADLPNATESNLSSEVSQSVTQTAKDSDLISPNPPINESILSLSNVSSSTTSNEDENLPLPILADETIKEWHDIDENVTPESDIAESPNESNSDDMSYDYLFGATIHKTVEDAAIRSNLNIDEELLEIPEPITPVQEKTNLDMPLLSEEPKHELIDFVPIESGQTPEPNNQIFSSNVEPFPIFDPSLLPPPSGPPPIISPPPAVGPTHLPPPPAVGPTHLPPPPAVGPTHLPPPPQFDNNYSISDSTEIDEITVSAPLLGNKPQNSNLNSIKVQATLCNSGHPNSPRSTSCRLCKTEINSNEIITIPRPSLGTLKFSTGLDINLENNILIGRSPQVDKAQSVNMPQIVALKSKDQNISRNHLEIRIEGWNVVINDLSSINGTIVKLPSHSPQRLRPNERVQIVPGTEVIIADEVSFIYHAS